MKVSHGVKTAVKKGEDANVVLPAGEGCSTALFAVFDGHGCAKASAEGVKNLAPALQKLGVSASDEAIFDTFWAVDADLGGKTTDGSTATVLLVEDAEDGSQRCCLVWVGDSQAAVLDMPQLASGVSLESSIVGITSRHVPDDPAEEARLNATWQVSRKMRLDKKLQGESAPPVEAVQGTAREMGITLSEIDAVVLSRAIERGARIDRIKFGELSSGDPLVAAMTSVLAPRVPGGKNFLHKVSEPITTPDGSGHSMKGFKKGDAPSPASSAEPSVHGGVIGGVEAFSTTYDAVHGSISTACSRALGDWDGSRALVPQPEIMRFNVPSDGCMRVVIASDGLWDLMAPSHACEKVLARERDAQDCAYKLVNMAIEKSNMRFNQLKDDTSVIVVELNPSGGAVPLTKPAAAGCCLIA